MLTQELSIDEQISRWSQHVSNAADILAKNPNDKVAQDILENSLENLADVLLLKKKLLSQKEITA